MITRWEIRENNLTSGSVYILAIVGDEEGVAALEKELYFFCKLVPAKLPPFTHIFELSNITDDDMLEKIRVKIEECINEPAGNATVAFSKDEKSRPLNLDVISPETQIYGDGLNFQRASSKNSGGNNQDITDFPEQSPKAVQGHSVIEAKDIFSDNPGNALHIAEATRYQEAPTARTNSKLALAKEGLSYNREADIFDGEIQLENELDVGDGTFISLDTASAKKLQDTTDFNPNAGLSGLLKGGKLEPLNANSSDPRNVSSEGVSIVPHVQETASGGSLLNKIFKKFSGSSKKSKDETQTTTAAVTAEKKPLPKPPAMPPAAPAVNKKAEKSVAKTNITASAEEVFKDKHPSSEQNIIVREDEPLPQAFKKTEVKRSVAPHGRQDMQGPLANQTSGASENLVSKMPVDDIFAAETICDFYANSEEFTATKPAAAPSGVNEIDSILAAKPAARAEITDDFMDVPNLLGSSKGPKDLKAKPAPKKDESPLGSLLDAGDTSSTMGKVPQKEEAKRASWENIPQKPKEEKPKQAPQAPVKVSAPKENIVLMRTGDKEKFNIPESTKQSHSKEGTHVIDLNNTSVPAKPKAAPQQFKSTDQPSVKKQETKQQDMRLNLHEATNIADMGGYTGVLGRGNEKPAMPAKEEIQGKKPAPIIPPAPKPFIPPAMPKGPKMPPKAPQAPREQLPPSSVKGEQPSQNMVQLRQAPIQPRSPLQKPKGPLPPPPPGPKNFKPAVNKINTVKHQQISGERKQNMTQEDLNKIKNLAKPEQQEEEQPSAPKNIAAPSVPQSAPVNKPVNLKPVQPQNIAPQTPRQGPAMVPPAARPVIPQQARPVPQGTVRPVQGQVVRPVGVPPLNTIPGRTPVPAQRPIQNPAQRPVPQPAARPAQQPAQQAKAVQPVKEDVREKTKTTDHTIQIPVGQIYKKNNWPLEVPLVPTFTFENMDLASNRFPHAAAMSVMENLGTMHNPFVLYGEGGSGKTHFLNAMGYELSKKVSQEKIFITNGVRLARGIQRYVEEGKKDSLEEFFKNAEVLIIDDIHLTAVNDSNREFISKLLNRFLKEKKQIIISSKYPPESLERFEELVSFRLDQGWVSELKQPRPQHFGRIYNKMVQDSEMNISETQAQAFFGTSGYSLGEISRYIRNAKVLYRRIKDSNGPAKGYEEILMDMLAISGEDQKSEIIKKSFEDIVSLQRGENMDWGSFGFFFPQDQADKFKWIAYSTMQRAKELGIKGGFNFALKSAYSTDHIISSAFKIANICDNKNLKGAIILGPSSISCTPSIRDNFYDILSHMLEIMMIRCGIINAEAIKLPSSYVKVLGDVLK